MFSTRLAQAWALLGFTAILSYAIYRLSGHFLTAWQMSFEWYHWLLLAINCVFMAYSEGYKGFQKSYSIKFANRLKALDQKPSFIRKLLAPLFCMNYFAASKKNMILAYILTIAIIILVIIFNQIPQPWRGILDAGVVVGLTWGLFTTIAFGLRAIK
ncbi:MAG: hypothetical protein HWE16_09955 [Gammaproteobacteria bacterium]|nr:hypothetical protein [Gammaproteobacteria bacterium]